MAKKAKKKKWNPILLKPGEMLQRFKLQGKVSIVYRNRSDYPVHINRNGSVSEVKKRGGSE